MKTPKFFSKLSAVLSPRPKKKLQASARAARRPMDDYDEDEEPTTNLSSAFVVVLILHVVAVGGIYAFNSIKQSRKGHEPVVAQTEQAAPAVKPSAQEDAPAAIAPAAARQSAPARETSQNAPVPAIAQNNNNKPATAASAGSHQYTVKAGDNLTKLAIAYNITPAEIMEANHLKEGAVLHQGQTLTIPAKSSTKTAEARPATTDTTPKQTDIPATTTTPGLYTVKKGDTPTSIARSLGVPLADLLRANKNTDPKKLQPGQTLKVPRKS